MDNYYDLYTHPLFKNCSKENLKSFSEKFQHYSCDEGAVIYYQKDGAGSLYLFLEGEFCASDSENLEKLFFLPGDFTDPQSFLNLENHKDTLICRSPGRYLKLDRGDFLELVGSLKACDRELSACCDDENRLISGFNIPMNFAEKLKSEKISIFQWRRSSFFLFEKIFYPFTALVSLLLFSSSSLVFPYDTLVYKILSACIIVYVLIRLTFWLSEKFVLTEKNISAVKISFRPLGIKRNLLPLDQIRGIKVEKKKLKNRFFNIGSILIQTSSGTVLQLSDIDKPQLVQKTITDFINKTKKQSGFKERIEIRKKMEKFFDSKENIHGSDRIHAEEVINNDIVFKKSLFFLISSIWWQIISIGAIIFLAWIFRDSQGAILTLPVLPLISVLLWRIQDWRNDLYKVTNGKIIDINKKPFGKSESNNLADICFVTNIRSEKKGILQYIFNYGDVLIETAGGSIRFETVSAPLEVQAKMLLLREQWKEQEDKKNKDRQFQDFLVYSEIYKQAEEQKRINRSTPPLAQNSN